MIGLKMTPEVVYVLSAVKRDADGRELSRRSSDEQHNVFTNYGVDAIFGGTTGDSVYELAAVVGTGSATPLITSQSLSAFKAGAHSPYGKGAGSWVDNGDGTGYVQTVWTTVFAAGVATGNISEVGSAFRGSAPNSSTPLCSIALVLDAAGNPTTFEVLADEELELKQYFRRHISYTDQTAVLGENGIEHTLTWRPGRLIGVGGNYNWPFPAGFAAGSGCFLGYSASGTPLVTLPPITSDALPSINGGTGNDQTNTAQGVQFSMLPYTAGSKKRRCWLRFGTGASLLQTWASFDMSALGYWVMKIEPPVVKSNLHRFTLTMEFELDNTP